jgi:hypothetical protein
MFDEELGLGGKLPPLEFGAVIVEVAEDAIFWSGHPNCHRADQNRPEVSDSKPATLKQGIHISSVF